MALSSPLIVEWRRQQTLLRTLIGQIGIVSSKCSSASSTLNNIGSGLEGNSIGSMGIVDERLLKAHEYCSNIQSELDSMSNAASTKIAELEELIQAELKRLQEEAERKRREAEKNNQQYYYSSKPNTSTQSVFHTNRMVNMTR